MPKRAALILILCFAGLLVALVGGVYALVVFLESVTRRANFSPSAVRLALSGAFLAGALVLYAIKQSKLQFAYGMLEVAVGLVSNWLSLDSWFNPVLGPGLPNVIYARLGILFAGIYIIVRGISNVVEGYEKFFPGVWTKVRKELKLREIYIEAAYAPKSDVPKDQLKFQIWSAQERIEKLEKKLEAAAKRGRAMKYIQRKLELSREDLKIATTRYEKEVEGADSESVTQE